jgi:diadenosine tetraphosphate (Ap4A) HIT family hydrolase
MAKYEATTKDNKCIFCEIVVGRIPASIFWENDNHIAFLAIDPNTEGFSCVIPKEHFESDPLELPDETLVELTIASKKVGQILKNYYKDVGRVGFIIEGLGINHAHTKLIPMHGTENLKDGKWEQGLSKIEPWFDKYEGYLSSAGGPMADPLKLKELAENIKKSIK